MLWLSSKANPILPETTDCIQSTDYLHTKPDASNCEWSISELDVPQDFILGYFQPSLRDWSLSPSNPGLASWATLSRPYGTRFGESSLTQARRAYFTGNEGWVPHCPNFLRRLVALIRSMRLSLMKGAHADLSGAAWQEIGAKPGFGLSGIPQHSTRLFLSLGGSRGICSCAWRGFSWREIWDESITELSSRPERSVVEGPAVSFPGSQANSSVICERPSLLKPLRHQIVRNANSVGNNSQRRIDRTC
jgi:hypothetical protein